MKALYIFLFVLILSSTGVYAQQQGQYSQYMMNYTLVNPGASGTDNHVDIRTGYRMQWLGLDGGPRNYYVSGHVPINKKHTNSKRNVASSPYHVIGGVISGQTIGVFSHNTGYVNYAYHLPLTSKWVMSMGAVAGFNQFGLSGETKWIDNVPDPTIEVVNHVKFDLGLGIWMYSEKLFFGLSSMQVLQNKVDFNRSYSGADMLNRHFYLTGGYNIEVTRDIKESRRSNADASRCQDPSRANSQ